MRQKGFGHILLLIGIFVIIGTTAEIYYLTISKNPKFNPQTTVVASTPEEKITPAAVPSPDPIILRKTYTNSDFGYIFTYPAVLRVQADSEDDYSKRNGGDARANFTGYVKYPPEKVLSSISVLGKDPSFENSPFTIWIFDNPNILTPDEWFDKYWYYPFLWGVFDRTSKEHITPEGESTISGQMAKYKTVSYQQGSPKYFYLQKGDKMFLFRLLTGSDSTPDHILESFRFTDF